MNKTILSITIFALCLTHLALSGGVRVLTASSPSSSASQFITDCMNGHNTVRNKLGVGSMKWDTSLASAAKAYAQKLASASTTGNLVHSGSGYGENLASAKGSKFTTSQMVKGWADEVKYYIKGCTYPKCTTGGEVGHYTQMVWRNSVKVGCGYALDKAKSWGYLVCRYTVHGNIPGEKVY